VGQKPISGIAAKLCSRNIFFEFLPVCPLARQSFTKRYLLAGKIFGCEEQRRCRFISYGTHNGVDLQIVADVSEELASQSFVMFRP